MKIVDILIEADEYQPSKIHKGDKMKIGRLKIEKLRAKDLNLMHMGNKYLK